MNQITFLKTEMKLLFQGCRVKDHIINLTEVTPGGDAAELTKLPQHKVYDDLLAHRDIICVPYQRLSDARYACPCVCVCVCAYCG